MRVPYRWKSRNQKKWAFGWVALSGNYLVHLAWKPKGVSYGSWPRVNKTEKVVTWREGRDDDRHRYPKKWYIGRLACGWQNTLEISLKALGLGFNFTPKNWYIGRWAWDVEVIGGCTWYAECSSETLKRWYLGRLAWGKFRFQYRWIIPIDTVCISDW